jgi:hypothetical protein
MHRCFGYGREYKSAPMHALYAHRLVQKRFVNEAVNDQVDRSKFVWQLVVCECGRRLQRQVGITSRRSLANRQHFTVVQKFVRMFFLLLGPATESSVCLGVAGVAVLFLAWTFFADQSSPSLTTLASVYAFAEILGWKSASFACGRSLSFASHNGERMRGSHCCGVAR